MEPRGRADVVKKRTFLVPFPELNTASPAKKYFTELCRVILSKLLIITSSGTYLNLHKHWLNQ